MFKRTILSTFLFTYWILGNIYKNHKKISLNDIFFGIFNTFSVKLMMTSSNGKFRFTGPLCGEFTGHRRIPLKRPVTWSFDVFFDLRLNKRLSKQPWGWWFETPSRSLWRHYDLYRDVFSICNFKSIFVQIVAWCRHTNTLLKQCWSKSMSQNDVTMARWVKYFCYHCYIS